MEGYFFYFLKEKGTQYKRLLTLTSETNIGIFPKFNFSLEFPIILFAIDTKTLSQFP